MPFFPAGTLRTAPSKWQTFRTTRSPGQVYNFANAGSSTYIYEEYFARVWLSVVHNKRVTVLIEPNYRTEQFKSETPGEKIGRS